MSTLSKIKEIEDEMARTQKNKCFDANTEVLICTSPSERNYIGAWMNHEQLMRCWSDVTLRPRLLVASLDGTGTVDSPHQLVYRKLVDITLPFRYADRYSSE